MKTPRFWQAITPLSLSLLPLSYAYYAASKLRAWNVHPRRLSAPVICVGNLTAGGAGKTPVALALGQWCKENKIGAFFLSRGYGGSLQGPLLVNEASHSASQVGDEPLLLSRLLPTVVSKDRLAGAQFAIAQGATLIIMDDGLQNPSLHKDLSLAVVDADVGFGNGLLIPAGPLRQPVGEGLAKADAAVIINGSLSLAGDKPVLEAFTEPLGAQALAGKKLLAFCGIAYPQKFFSMLASSGLELAGQISFADHHPYSPDELIMLAQNARKQDAQLVTTAKDAVRLPKEFLTDVAVVDVALRFANPSALHALLAKAIRL